MREHRSSNMKAKLYMLLTDKKFGLIELIIQALALYTDSAHL